LANQLSAALRIDVSERPRRFNYLMNVEDATLLDGCASFVPISSIRLASDKRLLAQTFLEKNVPTPQTILVEEFAEVQNFVRTNAGKKWCLKYPTSCGASGHRTVLATDDTPPNWPAPYVVQEFIELKQPEVYRTYCAGGEMFGWVARRFPPGSKPSPWVAHARGARYVKLDAAPVKALEAALSALQATGLWDSFGCVDLLCRPTGEWLVLEVGTDGLFNHVDRDIGDALFERQIEEHITAAFWRVAKA
jgi:glutathione synthase/RimK-type ligase-like ATP-grasp enzyme